MVATQDTVCTGRLLVHGSIADALQTLATKPVHRGVVNQSCRRTETPCKMLPENREQAPSTFQPISHQSSRKRWNMAAIRVTFARRTTLGAFVRRNLINYCSQAAAAAAVPTSRWLNAQAILWYSSGQPCDMSWHVCRQSWTVCCHVSTIRLEVNTWFKCCFKCTIV